MVAKNRYGKITIIGRIASKRRGLA